jgi:flagellar biosynthetic protein FliR
MFALDALNPDRFVLFTLVLTRVSGVVVAAPVFGTTEVPPRIRALFAIALAMLVMPTQADARAPTPATLVDYLVLVGGEALVGLALGLGVMILFAGVQLAGQIVSQASGMSLADVFDPTFDVQVPLFSELLRWFALAVFVTIGGHRLLLEGLLGTFQAIPPGQAGWETSLAETLSTLVTESFALGIRAAAPAVTAILLATLVLGLIGRTVPQLNVLALGFGLNALVTLLSVALSLGAIAWVFQEQLEPFIGLVVEAVGG